MSPSLWDHRQSYECVALEELSVEVPIGVEDWEKIGGKTQLVTVLVELFRHRGAMINASLKDCIDYGALYSKMIEKLRQDRAHTLLLETIAEEIVALCLRDRRIKACRVILRKPHVLNGRAVPRLEIYRTQAD